MTGSQPVELRDVVAADLPTFFEHQRDPVAVRMAAFRSRERAAFMAHWARILADRESRAMAVLCGGALAGNVGSYSSAGMRLVGYWIGREFWGRGVATAALAAFLQHERQRPLHAFVAVDNTGSIRVLEKCGFVRIREERGVASDAEPEPPDEYVYALA